MDAAYRVQGRVQGVGFRWWTQRQATRLGLGGTVRNCSDGAVEVHLRGAEPLLREMHGLLASGPEGARVDEIIDIPFQAPVAPGFSIVR